MSWARASGEEAFKTGTCWAFQITLPSLIGV
jgi:hypothetical protein